MDEKEKSIATAILNDVSAGSFTDEQIELLWMKLREHVPKNSLVREFGDFVAHRPRDRGIVYRHVRTMIADFKSYPKKSFTVGYALTEAIMLDDLRSRLTDLDLPIPDTDALQLMLIVSFFTMQFALLRKPAAEGADELGRMHPYATENELGAMVEHENAKKVKFWFRILKVDRDEPVPGVTWHRPIGPVRVQVVDRKLVVADYKRVSV